MKKMINPGILLAVLMLAIIFPKDMKAQRNGEYAMISELNDGTIYKIAVSASSLYKLDRSYFTAQGINPDQLVPANLQLFGNGGGMLPESLSADRIDDLAEIPLFFVGDGDQQLEDGEYFIFYGEGADVWRFDYTDKRYRFEKNIYDTDNYYFLKIDGSNGRRIETVPSHTEGEYTSSITDVPQVHELDKTNLLAQFDHTEGTGQSWYGESFFTTKSQDFLKYFDFENRIENEPIQIYAKLAARNSSTSLFELELNEHYFNQSINGVSVHSPEATFARNGIIERELQVSGSIDEIKLTTNAYQAWLDKIEINHRKSMNYKDSTLLVSDRFSIDYPSTRFTINSDNNSIQVWDITDPTSPYEQEHINSSQNQYSFNYISDQLRRFLVFSPGNVNKKPGAAKQIVNQNLHGIFEADMVIVYHDDFETEVHQLADHRREYNGYIVETIEVGEIFNEFSSGKFDPTALRDFSKMIYDRYPDYNFLLLMGDGSYDYRAIINESVNDNFVPVYETEESLNPISGYVSDDYFALLSDSEGIDLNGDLDIAVGRLPIRSASQAATLVDKIIQYETSPQNDGDWQNRIALLADDEDYSRHLDQTEDVAVFLEENHPVFNLEKIYFDAFLQEVNPGGHRYPDANKSINDNVFKGLLAMTYIGHGGPGGLAQERVLKLEDIHGWNNELKLPLLITATCSFAGFDDPAINTAGEAAILKENGGVIALFSTVRLVYSNQNSTLINSVFKEMFKKYEGQYQKLGDILKHAKNNIGSKDNKRKFFLFGDPAMQLAMPSHKVFTTKINDIDVTNQIFPDTLNALSKVRIEGYVGDESGNIQSDFNGTLYPTVFDKVQIIETLGNDPGSYIREFNSRKRILFKGAATVVDGKFSFEFIIPKDIDYSFGEGKISYYYSNGDNRDANGYFTGFIVGGSSDTIIVDNEGPHIDLYMNHTDFESGDVTNSRPVLLAHISDETGINISGTSIGHDLGAILDNDQQKYYVLNQFFESSIDDYTSGVIRFPMETLEPGEHSLYVEAWDVLNNKGEASIDFIVVENEEQILKNIFSYPNPLLENTTFYFEHTLPDTELSVDVSVFDVSGRLVKTISANAFTDGHMVNGIKWDGTNKNPVPNGVYFYTIKVYSNVLGISVESPFKKLVIIK